MNGGSDFYKPYQFLKECNMNFQMHICKFSLTDSGFLLISPRNCKKNAHFGQFKHHNSGRKHVSQTNNPTFLSTSMLSLQHSFFHLTIVKIHFHVVPTLFHSCLYKEPQFWAKTTDMDSPSYFSRK